MEAFQGLRGRKWETVDLSGFFLAVFDSHQQRLSTGNSSRRSQERQLPTLMGSGGPDTFLDAVLDLPRHNRQSWILSLEKNLRKVRRVVESWFLLN